MRIDFREERRWKVALAFNLAHAVMEWHEAQTLEERVRRGICVLWRRPREPDAEMEPVDNSGSHAFIEQEPDAPSGSTSKGESTPINDDNSDEESDDEELERDQQDVIDALDPATAIREALEEAELLGSQASHDIKPKEEELEDPSALHRASSENAMQVDGHSTHTSAQLVPKDEGLKISALKATSENPMLGTQGGGRESIPGSSKSKSKNNFYAPLREQIVYSELDKLFLDLDDFELAKGMSSLSTDDSSILAPSPLPNLSEIFPDTQPLGLLDVLPTSSSDGRKKSGRIDKDDPHRRADDTAYMKVLPVNDFMHHKATLLGPLQPAKHYRDTQWFDFNDSPVVADHEPTPRPVNESIICCKFQSTPTAVLSVDSVAALFDRSKKSPASTPSSLPGSSKDGRRAPSGITTPYGLALMDATRNPISIQKPRVGDYSWTSQDDALLKQLAEKYPNNWLLIADAFNSMKGAISTDRRSPADCFERCRVRTTAGEDHRPPPQTPTTQMTTRGTKRSMSMSTSASGMGTSGGLQSGEPKKRRRHTLMHDAIRKATKKKEALAKQNGVHIYTIFMRL